MRRQRARRRNFQFLLSLREFLTAKRVHRFWEHAIVKGRQQHGAYYHLVRELQLDSDRFVQYFRMSADQLELVLSYGGPMITKQTRIRDPIEPKQKLVICIRFMATGESFRSLAMQYRVGKTTVATIVPEVCTAIWASMERIYLVMPTTSEEWKRIAMNFQERWDYFTLD